MMRLSFTKEPVYVKNGIPYFGSAEEGDQFSKADIASWIEGGRFAKRWREKGQMDGQRNNVYNDLCKQAAELNLPIMELACGPGMGLLPDIYAINPNIKATAIDACPILIEHWSEFIWENAPGTGIQFASFNAADMPIAEHSVDVITSFIGFGSLRYAGANQLGGINEAYRVLKPGGRVFAIELEFEDRGIIQHVFDKWGRENWFKNDNLTWRQRFEQSGFIVEQENFINRDIIRDWELGDAAASFGLDIWGVTKAYVLRKAGFAIAIDGPVGVGKSTAAKMVAQMLGMAYIDTGAMYRAVAFYNMQKGTDLTDASKLEESLKDINISLHHIDGAQRVYLNGQDITGRIRTQAISEATSVIATNEAVRKKLVAQQQEMAKSGAVVMDGRDIGSQVLPWAQVKIYLDAAPEVRAHRRMLDLESKGQPADFNKILEETMIRDHRDKNRPVSPLIQTADAIYIDTANMTPQETAEKIVTYVKERTACFTNS